MNERIRADSIFSKDGFLVRLVVGDRLYKALLPTPIASYKIVSRPQPDGPPLYLVEYVVRNGSSETHAEAHLVRVPK